MADQQGGATPSIVLASECRTIAKLVEKLDGGWDNPEAYAFQKIDVISRLRRLANAIQARGD